MNRYVTAGLTAVAGAVLLEVALVPGILIGGAAVLAPRYFPSLRRRLRRVPGVAAPSRKAAASTIPARLGMTTAVAKTITFRIIVTSIDFTSNYIVLGSLATAAGLSGFALVVGPVFYFVHETLWNYYTGPETTAVHVHVPGGIDAGEGIVVGKALAKTVTFRAVATVIDFSATYWVVGDLATAAGLSAFGLVLGPFVYWGHEKAWERYSAPAGQGSGLPLPEPPVRLLQAPA